MKAIKIIAVILVLLVLVVIGIGVAIVYNTNRLIDSGVETVGSAYLGVPVTLESADFSMAEGRATLEGLEIANPEGYEGPYSMRLEQVTAVLDPLASTADTIVLKQVTITGAQLAGVSDATGGTNFQALLRQLDKSSEAGSASSTPDLPVKLIIDRLDFTGAQASIAAPGLTPGATTTIPDIHLKDIGRDGNGATGAEVAREILEPVTRALIIQRLESQFGNSPVQERLNEAMKKLESLGHPGS